MMAAQSKKRQKQRLIQVSSDIRLVLLNLKENCLWNTPICGSLRQQQILRVHIPTPIYPTQTLTT